MACTSDAGFITGEGIRSGGAGKAANIRQAAAGIIAVENLQRGAENYKRRKGIARRSLAIAEESQAHTEQVFWPKELDFLNEFTQPEPIDSVEDMGRRYGGRLASMVAGQFAKRLKETKCRLSRYCTSTNGKQIQDLMLARAQAVANAKVLGRSIAFAEYQARNDVNHARRLEAIGMGRGLMRQAATLFDAAGQGLAAVGSDISAQFNSALGAVGYEFSRDPLARDSVLDRISGTSARALLRDPVSDYDPASGMAGAGGMAGLMSGEVSVDSSQMNFGQTEIHNGETMPLSMERNNQARVSHNNLLHSGSATFSVAGITGGSVTVCMEAFSTDWADDQVPKMGLGMCMGGTGS